MGLCEMCGKEDYLRETKVEGSTLKLCKGCSSYGQVLVKPTFRPKRPMFSKPGDEKRVVKNAPQILQKKRSEKNMTQKEFATLLQEKLSVVQKWESGAMRLSVGTAKKLERILHVTLLENSTELKLDDEEKSTSSKKVLKSSQGFTLGDFIKVRKR
tara:strand:+ start:208 stop:675 length:468 start_codon:yes stop_codon:yes gene_type:complete